jgi:hypothetical protein
MAILGFAVSAAYWPGMLSAAFTPRWAVVAVGIALCSGLDPRNVPESVRWLLLFLLAMGGISLFASPSIYAGTGDLMIMVILCVVFLAGAEQESLDDVMTGLGYGLVPSLALCLVHVAGWHDLVRQTAPEFVPAGLFYNSEVLGEFCALVAVWAIVRRRWPIVLIAGVPLILTHSRVGVFTVAASLLYIAPISRVTKAAFVAALAIVAYLVIVDTTILSLSSAGTRITLWATTIEHWRLFGNGLGWFSIALPDFEFAHSDALQIIAELGIGGAAIAVIPAMALLGKRGNNAERALFVAVCIEALVSFPLHFPASGFLAALAAGYLVSVRRVVRMGEPISRADDGTGIQWAAAGDTLSASADGRSRRTVSLRRFYEIDEALRSREHRFDSSAEGKLHTMAGSA